MDNENTRLIVNETIQKKETPNETKGVSKKNGKTNAVVAGAAGFVAGAAVGVGATAMAGNVGTESMEAEIIEEKQEEVQPEEIPNAEEQVETPTPEQVILANDEGIRYAHVEADNFNDAFAQARAQVGAGGVFEYNGKLYGTYTKEEWDNMSADKRNEYQSRVFEKVPAQSTPTHDATAHHSVPHTEAATETAEHHEPIDTDVTAETSESIPANAEMIAAEPVDNEIRVLGVEAVQNGYGDIMNVALVECEGDQALLIDVDNNGVMDVLLHDDNFDGEIQESEVHDISGAGLEVADLLQAQAAQEGDVLYASYDDMPDYINDADSIMNV